MKRPGRRHGDQPQSPAAPGPGGRSVAAGGDISGIASTGDDAVNVQYRAERMTVLPEQAFRPWAELAAPAGLSNLPRPGLFVGRAGELARLDAAMAGPGGVVVQAVHGLGGVGKSTLAAQWAAAHAGDYTLTWWITAATPADIDAGLAALAVALQPALTGVLPLEALREGAVQWLAAHSGWLVILDNVTDPADVAPLLARAPAGRYLITSRRASGWHATGGCRSGWTCWTRPRRRPCWPRSWPRTGRGRRTAPPSCARSWASCRWPSSRPAPTWPRPAPPRGSTWTCWPATRPPCTRPRRKAATPPAPSPGSGTSPWTGWPMTRWPGRCCGSWPGTPPTAIPRTLLDGLADPPAVLRAVGRLAAYSMLTADAGTLAMHRLVQAVTRTPDPGDPHRDPQAIDAARDQATRQLADALPDSAGPGGLAGLADAAPAHRRPGQPRATGHRHPGPPPTSSTRPDCSSTARASPAARPGTSSVPWPTRAGAGRRPPRHPDLAEQPRRRLPGGGGPGPGHPAVRADPGRPACGCWAPTTPRP